MGSFAGAAPLRASIVIEWLIYFPNSATLALFVE
jgi:hypothetical protein